jgi:hypothetical protein
MNGVEIKNYQLPDNPYDLSKFVLVGREKLTSVRAEIRAIDKLQLAQEVRDQKRDEARMLSEALLDAEVRLGEMLQAIPKANKGNQYTGKMVDRNGADNQKPKYQVVNELGFSADQAERFETLANNKDLVEQAKAEARENDDIPTRTQVLNLAKVRNERLQQEIEKLDGDEENFKLLRKAYKTLDALSDENDFMESLVSHVLIDKEDESALDYEISHLDSYIAQLQQIKNYFLRRKGETNGKK